MSRRPAGEGAAVALFPFLAVLLCTMGSLILLLLVIARQAREHAEQTARRGAESRHADEEIERRREDLQWRNGLLAKSYEKTAADLASLRAMLSHLEEHSDRLRRQIAEADAALALAESQALGDVSQRATLQAELEELRRKIAEAEAKLKAAEKAGRKPQAFAIVPFDGAGGTRRRPIYVECRSDSIVLQPEGIVFHERDFAGDLGPSNPLASCLRAAAEHLSRTAASAEQPYPLLLVRPSGIPAYYAARAAMGSWDSDFGYELVNDDWTLEYPPADPQLAQMLARVVDEARLRQAMIARAAPSLRRGGGGTFAVAANGHGIERVGGGLDDRSFDDSSRASAGNRRAGGGRFGQNGFAAGSAPGEGPDGGLQNGELARGGKGSFGSGGGGPELLAATRRGAGAEFGSTGGAGGRSAAGVGTADGIGDGSQPGQVASGRGGDSAGGDAGRRDGSAQNGDGKPSAGAGGSADAGAFAAAGQTGEASGAGSGGNGRAGGGGGAMTGPSFGSGDPSAVPQTSADVSLVKRPGEFVESLAKKRGADWGLPNKARNATGLTRPIQIYCAADRLTLFADRVAVDRQIMFHGTTESAVDPLVNAVWDQVESWGLAGRGMYWKPVLTMHVAPDGEARYAELRTLLEGSGLEVVGKPITPANPPTAAATRR